MDKLLTTQEFSTGINVTKENTEILIKSVRIEPKFVTIFAYACTIPFRPKRIGS